MCQLNSFCGSGSLQTGTIVIGILSLLGEITGKINFIMFKGIITESFQLGLTLGILQATLNTPAMKGK